MADRLSSSSTSPERERKKKHRHDDAAMFAISKPNQEANTSAGKDDAGLVWTSIYDMGSESSDSNQEEADTAASDDDVCSEPLGMEDIEADRDSEEDSNEKEYSEEAVAAEPKVESDSEEAVAAEPKVESDSEEDSDEESDSEEAVAAEPKVESDLEEDSDEEEDSEEAVAAEPKVESDSEEDSDEEEDSEEAVAAEPKVESQEEAVAAEPTFRDGLPEAEQRMYDKYCEQFSHTGGFGHVEPVDGMPVWLRQQLIHPIDVGGDFYKPRVELISKAVCRYANRSQKEQELEFYGVVHTNIHNVFWEHYYITFQARDLLDTSEDENGKIKTYNALVLVRDYHSRLRIRIEYVDPAPPQPEQLQLANEHLLPQDG